MKKAAVIGLVLFGVFVLICLYGLIRDPSVISDLGDAAIPKDANRPQIEAPVFANFDLDINKFTHAHGYYSVVGEIKNKSSKTFHFVSLEANFLDKQGRVVGRDTTYACAEDYILPGGKKAFEFSGENQDDYNSVRVRVERASEVGR